MKKYIQIITLLLSGLNITKAQNLVPDSSFEIYTVCPNAHDQVYVLSHWSRPTLGSSDYYNVCDTGSVGVPNNFFGYQSASEGNGYGGFWAFSSGSNAKEYLSSALSCNDSSSETCTLTVGVSYQVSMDVSLAEYSNMGCDGLGVYFLTYPLPASYGANWTWNLPFTAQIDYSSYGPITDTLNWVTLTDTITADSAYRYIIVGAVLPDSLQDTLRIKPEDPYGSSYYYVDNVKVVPIAWSPPTPPPTTGVQDKRLPKLTVFPNPVQDKTSFHLQDATGNLVTVMVMNTLGQTVWKRSTISGRDIIFERETLPSGIYYYKMTASGQVVQNGKLVLE